jgi:prepilin-type processing-associated H-X9-DG protein
MRTLPLRRTQPLPAAAFTLTELLVMIGILAFIVATGLPALCRAGTPVQQAQCMANCRQIGAATLLYRNDNHDDYPYGIGVTYGLLVTDPRGWPMQVLQYMGGYTGAQPKVYLCPSEQGVATNWVFQLHYQANRAWFSDVDYTDRPVRGSQVRNLAMYWVVMDKAPADFGNMKPGLLGTLVLPSWNDPPGWPQYRRHSGGLVATAADGHVEWIRTPPYQPGAPSPTNFLELGDCANGQNPHSTWPDNGTQVKLFTRYSTTNL